MARLCCCAGRWVRTLLLTGTVPKKDLPAVSPSTSASRARRGRTNFYPAIFSKKRTPPNSGELIHFTNSKQLPTFATSSCDILFHLGADSRGTRFSELLVLKDTR